MTGRIMTALLHAGMTAPVPPRPRPLPWAYDDGGRAAAGYEGTTGDCMYRAVAIASGRPYQEITDELNAYIAVREARWVRSDRSSHRNGVNPATARAWMASAGWAWTPVMHIGSGCQVHLTPGELPPGRLVARVSRHYCAVVGGTVRDLYDPCRDGTRCVYGYWSAP